MSVRSATAAAILLLAAPLGATAYCEVESFLDEFTDEPHSVTFACTSDDGQAVWRMDYYVAEDSLLMSVYDPFNLPMLALDKLMKAELDAISRDEVNPLLDAVPMAVKLRIGEHPMMVHDGYYVDTWPEALTIPLLTEEQAAAVFAALAEPGETRRIIYQIEALEIRRVPLPDDTKGMLAEFWQHVRDSLSPLPDDDG